MTAHKEGKLFSSVELCTSRVKRRVNGVISAEASVTRHAPQMRFLIALISLQSRLRRYSDFAETSTFREKTACPSRTPDNAEMNIPTILFMSPVRCYLTPWHPLSQLEITQNQYINITKYLSDAIFGVYRCYLFKLILWKSLEIFGISKTGAALEAIITSTLLSSKSHPTQVTDRLSQQTVNVDIWNTVLQQYLPDNNIYTSSTYKLLIKV